MKLTLCLIITLSLFLPLMASDMPDFTPPSEAFNIPDTRPDVVITSSTMTVKDGIAILEGTVRATRQTDVLTCGRAVVSNSPRWMHATLAPRIYRKESILEQKLIRETTVEARSIFFDNENGKFNASDTVHVKIDERTWDLATHTWVIITSDEMTGYRDSNRLLFTGNVIIRDKERFGRGNRLDYLQDSSTAILTGDAYIETTEINEKTGEEEKRIIQGNKITYNTETREATSE